MKNLNLIGRILFAVPLILFGVMHFGNAGQMAGMVPIPFAQTLWVYITGAALIAAGVSIIAKIKMKLATMLLGILLLIFALTIHLPAVLGGDEMQMANVLKDTALAGAAFFISATAKS